MEPDIKLANMRVTITLEKFHKEIVKEYNDKGLLIHSINPLCMECEEWNEYDSHNNLIYNKTRLLDDTSREAKIEYEYNGQGLVTHSKSLLNGYETWSEYDSKGLMTHYETSVGYIEDCKYNEHGKCIYVKTNNEEEWYEYDSKLNVSHYKNSKGFEYWNESTNNEKHNHYFDSNKTEWWADYNDNGNIVYYKDSMGEEWFEYNDMGLLACHTKSDGEKKIYKYERLA